MLDINEGYSSLLFALGDLLNFEEVIFHYQRVVEQNFLKDLITTQTEDFKRKGSLPFFYLFISELQECKRTQ